MLSPRHQQELARLRSFRGQATRDLSLRESMAKEAADFRRLSRGLGSIAVTWAQIVPPDLADRVTLVGISRGVLTVRAADSAARYDLDRFLRGGGEAEIIRRTPVAIRRVKVVA